MRHTSCSLPHCTLLLTPSAHLESDPESWPPRFTKLELELQGGGRLAYVDSRR